VAFARRAGKYGKVSVHLADNLAGFSDDAREMTIQPNKGTFPRIGPLLRTENEYTLTADAHALAGAVRRIGGMVERNMPVILRYAGKTVEVFAYRDGDVAATETMTAEATVDSLEVQFNPGYLAPMLECFDGQVTLGFVGEALNKPKPVTLDSPEADTFRALVVPIKR
jgi:DNA polymerase III sliding clamp (beta) subunit (PCNA family)